MTAGRFTNFHARAVEVQRQMLPVRFGQLAAVAPTMLDAQAMEPFAPVIARLAGI
jgi:hypothetical protein